MALEQLFTFLVSNFWWLGVFMMGFISSATIFLPAPGFMMVFALGKTYHPFLLGIIGGLGSALGEFTGYYLGYGTDKFFLKNYEEKIQNLKAKFQKYHPSIVLFVFSFTPLPFDTVGILCGLMNYPVDKFFAPVLLGKILRYTFIGIAGFYGMEVVLDIAGSIGGI